MNVYVQINMSKSSELEGTFRSPSVGFQKWWT